MYPLKLDFTVYTDSVQFSKFYFWIWNISKSVFTKNNKLCLRMQKFILRLSIVILFYNPSSSSHFYLTLKQNLLTMKKKCLNKIILFERAKMNSNWIKMFSCWFFFLTMKIKNLLLSNIRITSHKWLNGWNVICKRKLIYEKCVFFQSFIFKFFN